MRISRLRNSHSLMLKGLGVKPSYTTDSNVLSSQKLYSNDKIMLMSSSRLSKQPEKSTVVVHLHDGHGLANQKIIAEHGVIEVKDNVVSYNMACLGNRGINLMAGLNRQLVPAVALRDMQKLSALIRTSKARSITLKGQHVQLKSALSRVLHRRGVVPRATIVSTRMQRWQPGKTPIKFVSDRFLSMPKKTVAMQNKPVAKIHRPDNPNVIPFRSFSRS